MITKATTRTNIKEYFLTSGMVDTLFHHYPGYNHDHDTCKRNPSELIYCLCIKIFLVLFKIFAEKDHTDDDIFKCIGLQQDPNIKDNIFRKTTTVSQ